MEEVETNLRNLATYQSDFERFTREYKKYISSEDFLDLPNKAQQEESKTSILRSAIGDKNDKVTEYLLKQGVSPIYPLEMSTKEVNLSGAMKNIDPILQSIALENYRKLLEFEKARHEAQLEEIKGAKESGVKRNFLKVEEDALKHINLNIDNMKKLTNIKKSNTTPAEEDSLVKEKIVNSNIKKNLSEETNEKLHNQEYNKRIKKLEEQRKREEKLNSLLTKKQSTQKDTPVDLKNTKQELRNYHIKKIIDNLVGKPEEEVKKTLRELACKVYKQNQKPKYKINRINKMIETTREKLGDNMADHLGNCLNMLKFEEEVLKKQANKITKDLNEAAKIASDNINNIWSGGIETEKFANVAKEFNKQRKELGLDEKTTENYINFVIENNFKDPNTVKPLVNSKLEEIDMPEVFSILSKFEKEASQKGKNIITAETLEDKALSVSSNNNNKWYKEIEEKEFIKLAKEFIEENKKLGLNEEVARKYVGCVVERNFGEDSNKIKQLISNPNSRKIELH